MRAAWAEPTRWRALREGTDCPICAQGGPRDVLAEFPGSWVGGGRAAALPGYVSVVCKRHVVEPYELPPAEQVGFWRETLTVARVLAGLFEPVKMNYEIHGNTIPHLHVHLYPRFVGDPYDTGALRPRDAAFTRTDAELARMAEALSEAADRYVAGSSSDRV